MEMVKHAIIEPLANLVDGSTIDRKDDAQSFDHIDFKLIKSLELINTVTQKTVCKVDVAEQSITVFNGDDNNFRLDVEFSNNKDGSRVIGKLVYFKENSEDACHVVGFQANINGRNRQQYLSISELGNMKLIQHK